MNRSDARELALHVILDMDYTGNSADEILETRTTPDYIESLVGETELYNDLPSKKQRSYIVAVAKGVEENRVMLEETISRHAIGWKTERISRITRCILKLAIYETLFVEDVPASVACNEAVKLTKKYDTDETASFVNGILGSFVRGETEA